ncbi:MAG: TonB-dependent receptor [Betaproteobacteria bacterium]
MRVLTLAAAAAASLAFATASAADMPDAQQLPPVEVIGTTPLPGVSLDRDQIAAPIQTGTSREIDRSNAIDLSGYLLRFLGSVYINDVQNNPFQPDLNYRGYTASPLLGTPQGLSVYMDGVRLNQPFGDVVSWDLIPRAAIATFQLMPGSNPLFGLNTLGGALSIQTKDGVTNPGTSVQAYYGLNARWSAEFEQGGSRDTGLNWYFTGNVFHEEGWRDDSPSRVGQLFGKVGWQDTKSSASLTLSYADTSLNGNGLQEQRFLARDYASVYTRPDTTRNQAMFLNLLGQHSVSEGVTLSGNAYYRNIRTSTLNGDINDDSLVASVYQPNAAERAALAAAGYGGFPASGENAANAPFPSWRCIANALLNAEPSATCSGLLNRSNTRQQNYGASAQATSTTDLAGHRNQLTVGAAYDASDVRFTQSTQYGYLDPDRSVIPVGAFADGTQNSENAHDTRVDLDGHTTTWSLYATDTLTLANAWNLTLSGRYNRTTVRNRDNLVPGGGPGSLDGDDVYARFNPAVGITYAPARRFSAYFGYNEGSRAPSSIELGCADPANPCKLPNAMAGDPPLKQVVAKTIEIGIRGTALSDLQWNFGVFRARNYDDILFVADNPSGFGYFRNFGQTRRQGVEAGLNGQAGILAFGVNYTHLNATYQSNETLNAAGNSSNDGPAAGFDGNIAIRPGDRIPLIPRNMAKVYADIAITAQFAVNADMQAFSGSIARGNDNAQHQPDGVYYLGAGKTAGYAVFNLGADYRPAPGLKFFAQINNLFDTRYSTAAQLGVTAFNDAGHFVARPFPASVIGGERPLVHATFYAPGAPRMIWAGIRYTFDARGL